MKKLKISDGQNFAIHIEEQIEEDNLFFHEYETAVKNLNNIWEMQKGLKKDIQQKGISEKPNNIIAFCGERGSGKSSVMLSFMNALENSGKKQDKFNFKEEIRSNNWNTQIMIDPSMFDGVHNIVDIVLTHIYQNFHEAYDRDNQKIEQYERQEMLSLLAKTYKSLSIIKNKEKMLDDEYDVAGNISKLQNLGESTQLRSSLEKLITRYLEIIPKLENRTGQISEKLLIAIDDLDLCNEHAYEMAEQIRKYLILPNVIIFMAVKIEQLEMGVEEKNREDFRNVIAGRRGDTALEQEMRDMAERYVTKLVPKARRIYLPKLESRQINLELGLEVQPENIKGNGETIENKVIQLIRQKMGMFLVPVVNNNNYFIPENLRELVNLISFLKSMKQPNGSTQIILENIYDFHSYFLEEILKKNINGVRLTDLLEVLECDDNLKNYNVGIYLDNLLKETMKTVNGYGTLSYDFPNTSLASVVDKLNIVSGYLTKREDYRLFYYIKIYYTILLNQRLYETETISFPLTGGFIWGNTINGIIPAVTIEQNKQWLNRERFFMNIITCWGAIADALHEWKPFMNVDKEEKFRITKKNQCYCTGINGRNKWSEISCWLLLALLSSPSNIGNNGRYYVSKGRFIYGNYAVLSKEITVGIENYLVSLCSIYDLCWFASLELLGITKEEIGKISAVMEEKNAMQIRHARIILLNPDLATQLLTYCRTRGDYKIAAEGDRTYHLISLFLKNISRYLADAGIMDVDFSTFWIPTGVDEQGNIEGDNIDICRVYARIFSAQERIVKEQVSDDNHDGISELEKRMLKQNFARQVQVIALEDYTGKIDTIPGYLINKTAQYVKTKLENIANCIQRYTYKEKKFPDGFISERIIKLYSEVIDLYIKNPESRISESQSNEYKEIAKIKDIIL